ncbi:DUF3262 family protein [Aromatoleum anaerobium]|uniref:DUF3262 family protein n=1 Tax=Aromatoleum anaerobium TaxID=182180 RepID=A0ABX1PPM4_9RHOO|nr:DUF3262 family protein [Aromatoleum anaerobium]MCK0508644.1 lytic transglycosylase domain-containing protein [Aromatoleum anaerobium]
MSLPRRLSCLLLLVATFAWAGVTYTDFLKALAQRESSLNPAAINPHGYAGLFQFGEAALEDVGLYAGGGTSKNDWTGNWTGKFGVTSLDDFLANPDAQMQTVAAYHAQVWDTLRRVYSADNYVGSTVNGIMITQSGLVAAAHLVGAGKVGDWLSSGGATTPKDGNGTTMTSYLSAFAGYSVGGSAPSWADVLAGNPTQSGGGGYVHTPPPMSAASSDLLSGVKSHGFGSAGEGFRAATGYQMDEVRTMLTELAAMVLLTWIAYVAISKWRAYGAGGETTRDMTFDILRAMVTTSIVLLWMA